MDDIIIYSIFVVALLLVLGLIIFFVYRYQKRTKKTKHKTISTADITSIILGLGTKDNIVDVVKEHHRIKITIVDPKRLNAQTFKDLEISAFLVGKEVKMLVKQNTAAVYKALLDNRGGGI